METGAVREPDSENNKGPGIAGAFEAGSTVAYFSEAELTGEWEYKLNQMEHGKLSRETFMAEIAAMTERMVV